MKVTEQAAAFGPKGQNLKLYSGRREKRRTMLRGVKTQDGFMGVNRSGFLRIGRRPSYDVISQRGRNDE